MTESQIKQVSGSDLLSPVLHLLQHPRNEALVEGHWLWAEDGQQIKLVEGVVARGTSTAAARLGLARIAPLGTGTVDTGFLLDVGGTTPATCAGCRRWLDEIAGDLVQIGC